MYSFRRKVRRITMVHKALFSVAVGSMLLASPAVTDAAYYSDDFSGAQGTALDGQAPDERPGTETWTAGPEWQLTGSNSVEIGTQESALLPLSPTSGTVTTVTARLQDGIEGTDASTWSAIGFSAESDPGVGAADDFTGATDGVYWMLRRFNDEFLSFEGSGTGGNSASADPAGIDDSTADMRVTLDGPGNSVTWEYKDPADSTWTELASETMDAGLLDSINHVGISSSSNLEATFTSFEVASTIPTPGTLPVAMGMFGLIAMYRGRRNAAS
jgi:hypothetical protein